MSGELLNICRDRGYQVFQCDAMRIPLRNECLDAAISIAVIHHFSTWVGVTYCYVPEIYLYKE